MSRIVEQSSEEMSQIWSSTHDAGGASLATQADKAVK
jgi:hypothetical protein